MYKLSLIFFAAFCVASMPKKQAEPAKIEAAPLRPASTHSGINKAEIGLLLAKYAKQSSKLEFAYFVQNWAGYAQILQDETGTPLAITLGVALLETGGGQSDIAQQSNNLFNIKQGKEACFYQCGRGVRWAKYANKEQSFIAFVRLVSSYSLPEITPQSFAQSPYIAGSNRADRERYAADLERIIRDYSLDKISLRK